MNGRTWSVLVLRRAVVHKTSTPHTMTLTPPAQTSVQDKMTGSTIPVAVNAVHTKC